MGETLKCWQCITTSKLPIFILCHKGSKISRWLWMTLWVTCKFLTAHFLIAGNYGLNLTVELLNQPFSLPPDFSATEDSSNKDTDIRLREPFIIGNVTFVPIPQVTSGSEVKYYYRYFFNSPLYQEEVSTYQPNLTRGYMETGYYHYTVHAFALVDNVLSHHANYSGYFNILGKQTSWILCLSPVVSSEWYCAITLNCKAL